MQDFFVVVVVIVDAIVNVFFFRFHFDENFKLMLFPKMVTWFILNLEYLLIVTLYLSICLDCRLHYRITQIQIQIIFRY